MKHPSQAASLWVQMVTADDAVDIRCGRTVKDDGLKRRWLESRERKALVEEEDVGVMRQFGIEPLLRIDRG